MLFLILLILSFISTYLLPWWAVAIVIFLVTLFMGKTSGRTFLSGFAAVFISWAVLALFKTIPNDNLLAKKVAVLFPLGGNWVLLLLITAIIGGLVGGMSALSGVLLKKAFSK
jgi:hypothetical protein